MGEGIGEAIDGMFRFMAITLAIFVPLGLWKLVDIVIWLFTNVDISIGGG